MAITNNSQTARISGASIRASTPRGIAAGAIKTYDVLIEDQALATGPNSSDPISVNDLAVICSASLAFETAPFAEVNRDCLYYLNLFNSLQIFPWLICTAQRVTRDRGQSNLFRVVEEYAIPPIAAGVMDAAGDLASVRPMPPPAGNDILDADVLPAAWDTFWQDDTEIIYEEATSGTVAGEMRLPTGSRYPEPFRQRHVSQSKVISQFEKVPDTGGTGSYRHNGIEALIEDRIFTTEDRTFFQRGGTSPPRWMITEIDFHPVRVPYSSDGVALDGWMTDLYLMRYVVQYTKKSEGWYARRGLVDKFYNKVPNDPTSRKASREVQGAAGTVITVQLNADGTLMANQAGPLVFKDYAVQPEGTWDFFKVGI